MSDGPDARQRLSRALADGESAVFNLHLDALAAAREGERAGWRIVRLDASGGRVDFLAECSRAFAFPDWFGGNWDALADSLSDVQVRPGVLVIWSSSAGLDRETRDIAGEIFSERAEAGPDPFVVVQLGRDHG